MTIKRLLAALPLFEEVVESLVNMWMLLALLRKEFICMFGINPCEGVMLALAMTPLPLKTL